MYKLKIMDEFVTWKVKCAKNSLHSYEINHKSPCTFMIK